MKLGINTYTYMWSIGFQGANPARPLEAHGLLKKAHQLGVKVLQIGPNLPLDKLPEKELTRLVEQAKAWGIELELGTRGLGNEHLRGQIRLCQHLGAGLLRTVPELGGQKVSASEIIAYVRPLLPELEGENLHLALENGNLPAAELRIALDELDSPQVGIVLDTTNSLEVAEGWREVTRQLAEHVMCLHYKDFVMKRIWSMMGFICQGCPAGKGLVEAEWLLRELQRSRYDFNVIVELWPPEQETLEDTIVLEQAWAVESVGYLREFIRD
jgi:sugar phosphate isomerase/epimerase